MLRDVGSKRKEVYTEPSRIALLGPPGCGKSECIRWTTRFFTECLGWEHGVQFQKLAPQHTMAALIGGRTVHGWGQIPINATSVLEHAKKQGLTDVDELFLRSQNQRYLLIDEISSLAALVCGILDSNLGRARSRQPYAKRTDGSRRPFGGPHDMPNSNY